MYIEINILKLATQPFSLQDLQLKKVPKIGSLGHLQIFPRYSSVKCVESDRGDVVRPAEPDVVVHREVQLPADVLGFRLPGTDLRQDRQFPKWTNRVNLWELGKLKAVPYAYVAIKSCTKFLHKKQKWVFIKSPPRSTPRTACQEPILRSRVTTPAL
jgi:hypothetical protein